MAPISGKIKNNQGFIFILKLHLGELVTLSRANPSILFYIFHPCPSVVEMKAVILAASALRLAF
jgi:hypothetical protein